MNSMSCHFIHQKLANDPNILQFPATLLSPKRLAEEQLHPGHQKYGGENVSCQCLPQPSQANRSSHDGTGQHSQGVEEEARRGELSGRKCAD
ncbi:hypothetical protein [Bradyrhizobium sp. Tv2a-2]|uniref:hypothetical protein n=1 Tax=Bradyrhizobium sp. Tv2a-2 TaxID=113395 RepID=UPI0012EB6218|nr:hypothetical protein [Bradyrhizobium sp. Tv2a-2]